MTRVLKSSNKIYANNAQGISKKKIKRRNKNAKTSDAIQQTLEAKTKKFNKPDGNTDTIRNGKYTFKMGKKFAAGNCGHYCEVAAYLINKKYPNLPLYIVTVDDPGDHEFLIAGEEPSITSLSQWREEASRDSYAFDGWAGILPCGTKEFPELLEAKLELWERQGKLITDNENNSWKPRSSEFYSNNFEAPLFMERLA